MPDVGEPAEVQQWMLGVFSNRELEEWTDYGGVRQYQVNETFEVAVTDLNSAGPTSQYRRPWEPRTMDSFAMFPAEDEGDGAAIDEYLVRPQAGASSTCGPYEVVTIYSPETGSPGPQPNPETIIRGAVCQRSNPPCPEGSSEGTEGCGAWAMEWCDEAPPPCEDG